MTQTKKILGIVGSYRKDGTVDTAVSDVLVAAAEGGAETEKVYLTDWQVEFCTNCRQCTQVPGPSRVPCLVHKDRMDALLARVDAADGVVIGAPVNIGGANALTQRFVERCIGYAYWPWGAPAPKPRRRRNRFKAVLVSSSAAPGLMQNRLFGLNAVAPLKMFAKFIGARVTGVIKIGMAAQQTARTSARVRRKCYRAGTALAR